MKSQVEFDEWFIEQHGPRQSRRSLEDLAQERESLKIRADFAQVMFEACRAWDNRRTSALWAWQAAQSCEKIEGIEP